MYHHCTPLMLTTLMDQRDPHLIDTFDIFATEFPGQSALPGDRCQWEEYGIGVNFSFGGLA
jgi:hypothetical protein